jgi:hypothetical protein
MKNQGPMAENVTCVDEAARVAREMRVGVDCHQIQAIAFGTAFCPLIS